MIENNEIRLSNAGQRVRFFDAWWNVSGGSVLDLG